jgi:hypothetical protein
MLIFFGLASRISTIVSTRIDRKLDEAVTRLGALERKVAGMEMDCAANQQRLDNVDRRLDRIERRLELADGAALPTSQPL